MPKTGLYYLRKHVVDPESYVMTDLVCWCPYEHKFTTEEESYENDILTIHVFRYKDGLHYLSYSNIFGNRVNVLIDNKNKINGIGARTDKEIIYKFIEWYRENGEAYHKEYDLQIE